MRIVSLGLALPNPQVDNHSIANAPSLFEYDACVINPQAVSQQIEAIVAGSAELRGPDQTPVQAGASGAFHYGLGELLQQRRAEITRLLQRGGIVVVLAYPNVPHPNVATLPGADRYSILPAAPGVLYRPPHLIAGDGRQVRPLDAGHPFASYLDDLTAKLRYRAHWDVEAIPDFDSIGTVFGRSEGGAAAAVEFQVAAGRVFFVPPPAREPQGTERRTVTDAMLESVLRALEDPGRERPPYWLRRYDLPNLDPARRAVEEAQTSFADADNRLKEARAVLTETSKYHGLLWRAGRYVFEPLVRDAFRALGFTVAPDLSHPAELRDGDEIALLEVDASLNTVKERGYLALQRRIEADFLRSGIRRKGVIVVNGERLKEPSSRREPYTAALANACENFGYALITGESLFALVTYALEGGPSDEDAAETLVGIRETILNTEGLLAVEEADAAEVAEEAPAADADSGDDATAASPPAETPEAAVATASPEGGD